jgi:uncharacterized protein (TIGR00369 family)
MGLPIDQRRDPFTELIGLVWDEVTPTSVRAHLDANDRHHQPMGIVHGGVYASIVEVTASVGAYVNAAPGTSTVGVSNNCSFLRSHRAGRLDVVATPITVAADRQLWEVRISRATDDKVVAVGTVELAAVPEGGYEPLDRP